MVMLTFALMVTLSVCVQAHALHYGNVVASRCCGDDFMHYRVRAGNTILHRQHAIYKYLNFCIGLQNTNSNGSMLAMHFFF